jgi:hypothetical protein
LKNVKRAEMLIDICKICYKNAVDCGSGCTCPGFLGTTGIVLSVFTLAKEAKASKANAAFKNIFATNFGMYLSL